MSRPLRNARLDQSQIREQAVPKKKPEEAKVDPEEVLAVSDDTSSSQDPGVGKKRIGKFHKSKASPGWDN